MVLSMLPLWACSTVDPVETGRGPGDAGEADAAAADAAVPDAMPADAEVPPCPCFLGDGPYCAARARDLAAAEGCELPLAEEHPDALLSCASDAWEVADDCPGECTYGAPGELDDACVLPVCDCFVLEAWCGSGAQEVADGRHCRIPLLPEHENDILYCPGGEWTVKQTCDNGCISAPTGTPDSCRGSSDYSMPFACGASVRCSSGNHTSNHSGMDEYAYDWAVPRGTVARAMRGGRVIRVRNVSPPGSHCYDGGGSECANLANTVEVRHPDGTIGLYMHLNRGTVSVGDRVAEGDPIGRTGTSGWSTGPHLHVQVQRNCGIWWCQSIPFRFAEKRTVRTGDTVTSENCH